jgi:UDP-N-acetylmuramate dehydrogenase
VRYKELKRALGSADPSLAEVREIVLRLRRNKGMVIDPTDPDTRSAGSFFTNPILPEEVVAAVVARALQLGVVQAPEEVPTYPATRGLIKLPAAWLIERAGIEKGYRSGQVGISSKHCLALVHYGGGRTDELIALAQEVQRAVYERWGVHLEPEPVRVGFSSPPLSASMVSK